MGSGRGVVKTGGSEEVVEGGGPVALGGFSER